MLFHMFYEGNEALKLGRDHFIANADWALPPKLLVFLFGSRIHLLIHNLRHNPQNTLLAEG